MKKRRLLVVDDELPIVLTLRALLEIYGFEVETAVSAKEAISKLNTSTYHMVITDMRMEHDWAGFDVVRAAREVAYKPAVALLTAFPMLGQDWKQEGADCMFVKPMNTKDLLRQIEALLVSHEDQKRERDITTAA
jgi:DNA-binding response OmpR family regulator